MLNSLVCNYQRPLDIHNFLDQSLVPLVNVQIFKINSRINFLLQVVIDTPIVFVFIILQLLLK